jgi:hypothetical protein
MRLTHVAIIHAKADHKQKKMFDGKNMYLLVNTNGSKYWRLDYRLNGQRHTAALGIFPEVSLEKARNRCDSARLQIKSGHKPSFKTHSAPIKPINRLSEIDDGELIAELESRDYVCKKIKPYKQTSISVFSTVPTS